MYEVHVYDKINDRVFVKIFNLESDMNRFLNKLKYSKKLKKIAIYDWSYCYD